MLVVGIVTRQGTGSLKTTGRILAAVVGDLPVIGNQIALVIGQQITHMLELIGETVSNRSLRNGSTELSSGSIAKAAWSLALESSGDSAIRLTQIVLGILSIVGQILDDRFDLRRVGLQQTFYKPGRFSIVSFFLFLATSSGGLLDRYERSHRQRREPPTARRRERNESHAPVPPCPSSSAAARSTSSCRSTVGC